MAKKKAEPKLSREEATLELLKEIASYHLAEAEGYVPPERKTLHAQRVKALHNTAFGEDEPEEVEQEGAGEEE